MFADVADEVADSGSGFDSGSAVENSADPGCASCKPFDKPMTYLDKCLEHEPILPSCTHHTIWRKVAPFEKEMDI